MKKQEYIDLGLSAGLTLSQIEGVLLRVVWVSKQELFTMHDISSKYIYEAQKLFFDMKNGVPEEYSLETANFYGRDFFVDERVLIPRNDTEVLVEHAIEQINLSGNIKNTVYADIGTGSACIPVSIVNEIEPLKFDQVYALDISDAALEVAEKNIENLAKGKIELLKSDLFTQLFHSSKLHKKNLFITANLPYIKNGDHGNMDISVVKNEPDSALYGWEETGFELYEKLIKQCFQLKEIHKLGDIRLFIEIGFDQREYSHEYLTELWLSFEYFPDSSNIERVISIYGF